MFLIAETKGGLVFEASNKRELTKKMIGFFAENSEEVGRISSIIIEKNDGSSRQICDEVVGKIQNIVDEGVAQWIKESETNNFEL